MVCTGRRMTTPVVILALGNLALTQTAIAGLAPDDRAYLTSLAADTWECIAYMADGPGTLPEDSTRRPGYTSVTNLGLYLACIVGARELGLITRDEALQRAIRIVDACEKLDTWHGFPQSWLDTRTLQRAAGSLISPVDLGNYEAGLIVCRQAFPELAERIGRLIAAMDWPVFYRADNGWLYGGWDVEKQVFVDWHYQFLAADSRTASLLAIAHGVPSEHWERLERPLDDPPGPPHYGPGWLGGGLFMQTMTALFVDESGTPTGRSAVNFAWAQIIRARAAGLPAWGWSACATPDGAGYIGYGELREPVVTPHASALAALYLPTEAVANLRELEKLGARVPVAVDGQPRYWGFRDCLDLSTGLTPPLMLLLDQGMLFAACANVLGDDCIRRYFQADPLFAAAREHISDYRVAGAEREFFWQQVAALRAGTLLSLPLDATGPDAPGSL